MLVDFGIARSFAPQQRGTMIGTEGYAPPEQYKGIADARGDIYALGATLHHLATGNDPRSETPFTFVQRPPRTLNPDLSPEFEELILKCVSYSPSDRYQSGGELIAALERINSGASSAHVALKHVPAVATRAEVRDRADGSGLLDASPAAPTTAPPPAIASAHQVLIAELDGPSRQATRFAEARLSREARSTPARTTATCTPSTRAMVRCDGSTTHSAESLRGRHRSPRW
jgi:serine/threonine protein kinase